MSCDYVIRQLAQQQLVWFKKDRRFQWLNMAPEGERLGVSQVAEKVHLWFSDGVDLPDEWGGAKLQSLVKQNSSFLH